MRPIHLVATAQHRQDPCVTELVVALRKASGRIVEIVEDSSSTDGLLLSWSWDVTNIDQETARRMLLLNAPLAPAPLFEHLERGGFAGGVPLTLWKPGKPIDMPLAGLRSVVRRLNVTPAEERYASEHYCYYELSAPAPLEHGIVEYLEALERELDSRS